MRIRARRFQLAPSPPARRGCALVSSARGRGDLKPTSIRAAMSGFAAAIIASNLGAGTPETPGTPGVPVNLARAQPAQAVQPLIANPIAPRGGVMMLPLAQQRPARGWPASTTLTLADGRRIDAVLAWIHAAPPRRTHWTADPRGLAIRPIDPNDGDPEATSTLAAGNATPGTPGPPGSAGSAGSAGTPVLLAPLPEDGEGAITLGGFTLQPVWRDLAPLGGERLPRGIGPYGAADRPDPDSPFEYWRWSLLAERLDAAPPHLGDFGEVEALLARHYADLWRIGLARLADESEGVAAQVRDLLTRICLDDDAPFAAWVADPVATGDLLTTLLNFRRSGESITAEALDWADRHEGLFAWIQSAAGDHVRLAIVNPSFNPVIVRLSWATPGVPAGGREIPLAMELEPSRLTRIRFERPARSASVRPQQIEGAGTEAASPGDSGGSGAGGDSLVLMIEWPDGELRFLPGPRARPVTPPGLTFRPFAPPMSLAALQGAAGVPLVPELAATAQLRRLRGRWELFFECRRPDERPDALIINIGADDAAGGPEVVLRVPETGWHELLRGRRDETLQVHRRSYADRWYARIVLPDAWLNLAPGEVTLFGFTRELDGEITHTPGPVLPWRDSPGRAAADLSRWDDLH